MWAVSKVEGVKTTPTRFRESKTAEDLRSFLETVNYLAHYIPQLSQLGAPLCESIAADLQDVPRGLPTNHEPVMKAKSPKELQQRIINRRNSNNQEIIAPEQQENTSRPR